MAERRARIVSLEPGRVRVSLEGEACRDCSMGCQGRCNVFAGDETNELELAVPLPDKRVGDTLVLQLDDDALRNAAWLAYGRALLGLLIGSGVGFALGQVFGRAGDLLTLAGLVCGTFLPVYFSKPQTFEPKIISNHLS